LEQEVRVCHPLILVAQAMDFEARGQEKQRAIKDADNGDQQAPGARCAP